MSPAMSVVIPIQSPPTNAIINDNSNVNEEDQQSQLSKDIEMWSILEGDLMKANSHEDIRHIISLMQKLVDKVDLYIHIFNYLLINYICQSLSRIFFRYFIF